MLFYEVKRVEAWGSGPRECEKKEGIVVGEKSSAIIWGWWEKEGGLPSGIGSVAEKAEFFVAESRKRGIWETRRLGGPLRRYGPAV